MIELKVPTAGESITEVVIIEWLKGEGALADQDEPVALIETDKANVEVLAPTRGRVTRILKKAGESARVGEVIGVLEEDAGQSAAAPLLAPAPAVGGNGHTTTATAPAPREPESAVRATTRLTPATRRALRETGTGLEDVSSAVVRVPPPAVRIDSADPRHEEVVSMTPLRKRVAERLVEAQQTAALLTTFNEVDMSAVMALRKQHQDNFVSKHGVKLGFMSFFVKAAIEALRDFPGLNAEIRGTDIIYHHFYDIGVAVGGGKGLVVPVIRNAEQRSFAEIEKTIAELAGRAKEGRLKVQDLQGGTFTISNGGIYGSMMSTPIINPPQSGILGMHAIQDRAMVRGGQIVVLPMMYLALTYDHRIVDGREAVSFLIRIKECIENPARILLEA